MTSGLAGAEDAYDTYKTAIHDAENVFGGAGIADGHSDAFRHAYWNAMVVNRFGPEWAAQYTTAHERVDTNSATAEAMDLHNNEIGRRIAAEHPDAGPGELKGYIDKAVRDGEVVVVGSDGRLVPSSEVATGETGRAQDDPATGGDDPERGASTRTTHQVDTTPVATATAPMTTGRLVSLAVVFAVLLTGCSNGGHRLTEDEQLPGRLRELRQNGGEVLLGDLAGGDWDTVCISRSRSAGTSWRSRSEFPFRWRTSSPDAVTCWSS
ncbi:DUF6973 domain-containing protein [Actinokineospora spheciospongiae]|uniref:DUF6973 domain-containing protein n=1 Tax=Actinokineospora spheciospongiae TaxID=909613 RepID=UPI000D9125C6|nr:hypothetical protein [Actinokineospora spheciospongiae]PWW58358.1 hypothetical protein DFQ13_109151 [Actinokineospora spheciospongiae]